MNEMKPEDVMKALEICVDKTQPCEDCPYANHCSDAKKDALALLREKDAQISALQYQADFWDKHAKVLDETISIQQKEISEKDAKIAELQSVAEFQQSSNMKRHFELQERDKQIKEKDVEIERLSHHCDDCAGCTQWKCDCSNIRAEAITEFAERLKRRFNVWNNAMYSETTVQSVITKVLKEMEGTLRETNDC